MGEGVPDNVVKTGTTTVGITCKDGVVMGTEHRATMGTLIAHKTTRKLFKIDENIGMAVAGLVGDAQLLQRYISAEVKLYRLSREKPITIKGVSTLMANILAARRYFPYWVQLLIGGVDNEGSHIYSLDAAGGSIEDEYVAAGSGSVFAYGVLEDHYKKKMSLREATELAVRSISAAMSRDAASGNGMDICQITRKKKYVELSKTDVDKIIRKIKP